MPLTAANAPDRDLVTAYTLTFGNEAGRIVLDDLYTFVTKNMAAQRDKEGRIDPFQVVAENAAERVLKRIQSMAQMSKNPQWQAIEASRQMAVAQRQENGR